MKPTTNGTSNGNSTFFLTRPPSDDKQRLSPIAVSPSFTPDPSWDLDRIYTTQDDHETGYFHESGLLAQWMKRDGRLQSVLETRLQSVFGLPFMVEPSQEEPSRLEKKAAKAFEKSWIEILPEKAAKEILEWVILMGFCWAQLTWVDLGPDSSARWSPRVQVWHPMWFRYDQFRNIWQVQTRNGGLQDIVSGDGRWVLFSSRDTQPWMSGAVLSLAIPVLVRSWTWKDWSNFNETLGQAFIKLIIPSWVDPTTDDPSSGSPSKATFLANAQGLGRTYRHLICELDSQGHGYDAKHEGLDGTTSYQAFLEARSACDTEITIRIKGQNLTTEVSDKGAKAASQTHEKTDQHIMESDCEFLATDARAGIGKPWAKFNFADPDLAPWAFWDPTPPEDETQLSVMLKDLVPALVILGQQLAAQEKRIDLVALCERFNLPLLDVEPTPAPLTPNTPLLPQLTRAARGSTVNAMIALYPERALQQAMALDLDGAEAPEDLHVTLAYLKNVKSSVLENIASLVRRFASQVAPLSGVLGGVGRFAASETSDEKDVIYAVVDVPGLSSMRERLVRELAELHRAEDSHDFNPHMTLTYLSPEESSPLERLGLTPVSFGSLSVVIENQREDFPLQGEEPGRWSMAPWIQRKRRARRAA